MTGNTGWRRLFVGRDEELDRLRAAWRLAAPDDDSTPEPQFVVLLGESGLGKTRLVQEFYRWLSREQDPPTDDAPEGYWPDAFAADSESLDVNPRFPEDATGRGRIPWLWWGIRFERPFDRNQIGSRCGLIDYRSGLVSHTGAIAAARALKQVGQDKRSKGVSVASSLAGTVAGIAGLGAAAAVGTLAGLAFTAKDLFSMRADKARAEELAGQLERSPGAAQAAEQTNLEEVALDYFRTVLDTSNPEAATVPVVLFLDDAQWADPVTLRFLARLLEEARKQHWPLLVVATHWEVEWKQTLGEPIGDVNRPPRLSAVTETLRQSDEGYSTWLELHTLPPVSDLSGIVRSALPGLSDEQRRVVLDKAGGNPLLLEEILLFLHRRPQFFESRQLDQPLTERGLEQLRAEKMNLEKLIDDRFQSLEEEVQRALGWSSEQ